MAKMFCNVKLKLHVVPAVFTHSPVIITNTNHSMIVNFRNNFRDVGFVTEIIVVIIIVIIVIIVITVIIVIIITSVVPS